MSNTRTIVAGFVAAPGQEERLREELATMIEPSPADEGCLRYRPYVDPAHPERMVIVEEWADAAAQDHHFTLWRLTDVTA
ncbi:putative quinol monooxygenase [Nonomuraea sp. SBT364]|uniref:putative quinol monooxygenase n=1 Tax=Nonomuraea sp. SBT364 TaxID=1580530 RepID=UPI00066C778D|nr:antibiotic biosynthesis monooxygenase [Nonomuraea sp. SBT364]